MSFLRQVSATWAVRVVLVPAGLVTAALTARWLGPGDLGIYAAIGALLGMAIQFGNLGLPPAITRAVAAESAKVPALVAGARLLGLSLGTLAAAVLVASRLLLPDAFGAVPLPLLALAALALPFNFAASLFQAVLLGRGRIAAYNAMDAAARLVNLAAIVGLLVIAGRGVFALLAFAVGVGIVQFAGYQLLLGADARRFRPDLAVMRGLTIVSARAYVTTLLSYLVLRSDMVLVNGMLGAASTGHYTVAVQGIDFLLLLPSIAGTILFPRVAAAHAAEGAQGEGAEGAGAGGAAFTASVCRHVALVLGGACVVSALAAPLAVRLLFGAAYAPSTIAFQLLLPGAWFMGLQSILSNDLAGRDYPLFLPLVWAVMLAVNVGANVVLLPVIGIAGAALSSTAAYALAAMLVGGYWLRRFPSLRVRDLLWPARGEVGALAARVSDAVGTRLRALRGVAA